jgi:uncharacterized membrane protein HdeD (DUF308 family)
MKQRNSKFFLLIGITLILLGTVLLLWTTGLISVSRFIVPLVVLLLGVLLLHRGLLERSADAWIFPGIFSILGGLLFILIGFFPDAIKLERIWPLFFTFVGISLVVYSYQKDPAARSGLFMSGFVISLISLFPLPFSLGLIQESFIDVFIRFWPVAVIFLGVVFLLPLLNRQADEGSTEKEEHPDV